jgi:hypothetical protein
LSLSLLFATFPLTIINIVLVMRADISSTLPHVITPITIISKPILMIIVYSNAAFNSIHQTTLIKVSIFIVNSDIWTESTLRR